MTKEEIQASIKSIMFSGSVCGIEIYACLRDESGYQTKKIRATAVSYTHLTLPTKLEV